MLRQQFWTNRLGESEVEVLVSTSAPPRRDRKPDMGRSRYLRDIRVVASLAGTYFVAGKLGLKLASVHTSATAVWPCTGIALAVESAPNGMVMIDRQGKIVMVNSHAMKMFGYVREELVGRSVEVVVPERFRGGHPEHGMGFSSSPRARPMGAGRDLCAVRKDGSEFPVEIGLNPIETEEGLLVLSAIVDISERKRAEEEILRLVTSDPLTGLANYRKLIDVLDAEIKRYGRAGRPFAVLLFDMDGLKKINDAHGHLVGSRALCRLANILQIHCRAIDTAARYGGDEFVLVLPETESAAAVQVAQRVSEQLNNDGEEPSISVSTGTATYPRDGKPIDELLAAPTPPPTLQQGTSKTPSSSPPAHQ